MPNFNLQDRYPQGREIEWERQRKLRFNFFSGVNQDYPKIEDYQRPCPPKPPSLPEKVRPTELQQIKGMYLYLQGKLNEHIDLSKRKSKVKYV